ncbi:MAG: hypothetical protein E7505_04300 [Ruminococcus sp.]|nr:hypothetical protein [Ruminococcus sp.]
MSAIGQLTKTILDFSQGGLGLIAAYGVVKIIKGRADDDPRSVTEGFTMTLISVVIIAVIDVIKLNLT